MTAETEQIRATILVPTRDRPVDLRRCLSALARQADAERIEVIVVDDGSTDPVAPLVASFGDRFSSVRLEGVGPARARNLGAAQARGPLLLLTDDDTEPAPGWADAACTHLERHPAHGGVEGPISTPAWDPLRAYSFVSEGPGAYLTCNVAYRRKQFDDVSGFFEGWPTVACEDQDLAYRVLRSAAIGFEPGMAIVHHPRAQTVMQIARRGLHAESSILLFERHPDRFGRSRVRTWLRPIVHTVGWWRYQSARGLSLRDPRRRARFILVAGAQTGCSAIGVSRAAWSRLRRGHQPTGFDQANRGTPP